MSSIDDVSGVEGEGGETRSRGLSYTLLLTLGALGVVFGDIGTSPIYAFRECFHFSHDLAPTPANVKGVISLIIWSITLVVTVKYLLVVLRADNRGQGGEIALLSLALKGVPERSSVSHSLILMFGLFGAALLYGDGMITPAISVLSAVEGLNVATHIFEPYILVITLAILVGLFSAQRYGTGKVGVIFGPIILVWFFTMAVLGVSWIIKSPDILEALDPLAGIDMLVTNKGAGFAALGSVFLALTGAEALYADLGHFGRRPIRLGWTTVAYPALVLNYLGQGALVISNPEAVDQPFYRLAPSWGVIPLVCLATAATVIASQALISGAFSLTSQAMQLGYLPRMFVKHTSSSEIGQIYIPFINWTLLIATVLLVVIFQSSSNLASAYGISVVMAMIITSVFIAIVANRLWNWSLIRVGMLMGIFICVDLTFFSANFNKIFHTGWVTLLIGAVILLLMRTWHTGRYLVWTHLKGNVPPFEDFFANLRPEQFTRVDGTAIFMIRDLNITPPALIFNLKHNKVLHKKVILLTVMAEEQPYITDKLSRVQAYDFGGGFFRIVIRSGFMEMPDVPRYLRDSGLDLDLESATFFMDRVIPIPTDIPGMAIWREKIFSFLSQNSLRATSYYQVPVEQVVEIGVQVAI